jgi:AhpC/TSA family/Copper type II ascorbate-dependent monooxygenase, C-terminal domain
MIRTLLFLSVFFSVPWAWARDSGPDLEEPPHLLKASEYGVGHRVPDVTFKVLQGRPMTLGRFQSHRPLVILIFSTDCPISNKYGPERARLEKDYGAKGVAFLFVDPEGGETDQEINDYVSKYGINSPVVHDVAGRLVKALRATTTTEAFLLDPSRTLVYRGAINDQYGLGYGKELPEKSYLRDALDALLSGRVPEPAATTAPGCALDVPLNSGVVTNSALTYDDQISRIFQANCVECHHAGGIGPFSLETYQDVLDHAGRIRQQVARGTMPPWFAAKLPGPTESPWANDRSLSERDQADLLAWLNSDRPQGDPADAPVARSFPDEWNIGKPDVVLQLPEPIPIKAEGLMPYQNRTIQTSFPEDRWVQAYEVMPTARGGVHHVIVSIDGQGTNGNATVESGATGFWAVYVPGYSYEIYPKGYARKLPAGAKLDFQIHYTPNGQATNDQLKIGLVFSKEPPRYEMHALGIPQFKLDIPPGAHRHVETADYHVSRDMEVTGYQAHTHLRGIAFRYELIQTNGAQETLLDMPRYDFNWQLLYDYATPKLIPAGSTIRATAVYDNSADNPANPDPSREVKWGLQTCDEMMIGYVEYFWPQPVREISSGR